MWLWMHEFFWDKTTGLPWFISVWTRMAEGHRNTAIMVKAATAPRDKKTAEPTDEKAAQPTTEAAPKPATAKPVKPAAKPASKAAAKPASKAAGKPAAKTAAKPAPAEEVKKPVLIQRGKLTAAGENFVAQITPASSKSAIREAILLLCALQTWTSREDLAKALKHKPEQLEILHLTPMVNAKQLRLRHPNRVDHPEQAYGSAK